MTGSKVIEVTDASFARDVLGSEKPVLLEFGAEWCPPCRVIIPVLEDLAAAYETKAVIAKLDVDENPATTSTFGIRNLPAILLLKGGQVVERMVGVVPKSLLKDKLSVYI